MGASIIFFFLKLVIVLHGWFLKLLNLLSFEFVLKFIWSRSLLEVDDNLSSSLLDILKCYLLTFNGLKDLTSIFSPLNGYEEYESRRLIVRIVVQFSSRTPWSILYGNLPYI